MNILDIYPTSVLLEIFENLDGDAQDLVNVHHSLKSDLSKLCVESILFRSVEVVTESLGQENTRSTFMLNNLRFYIITSRLEYHVKIEYNELKRLGKAYFFETLAPHIRKLMFQYPHGKDEFLGSIKYFWKLPKLKHLSLQRPCDFLYRKLFTPVQVNEMPLAVDESPLAMFNHSMDFGNLLKKLNLERLVLAKIEFFQLFTNLESLSLGNNCISVIENLDHMKSLRNLNLSGNNITKMENLGGLNKLEILNLNRNPIERIEKLDGLVNLRHLDLSQCKLTKVQDLDRLINLQVLNVQHNNINSVVGDFCNHSKLTDVNLDHNIMRSLGELETVPNMRDLTIRRNCISSPAQVATLLEKGVSVKWGYGFPFSDIQVADYGQDGIDNWALQRYWIRNHENVQYNSVESFQTDNNAYANTLRPGISYIHG